MLILSFTLIGVFYNNLLIVVALCPVVYFFADKLSYRLFAKKGDSWLTVNEVVERRGYQFEEHNIPTDDGYIIKLFRLRNPYFASSGLKPILIEHGLGANSTQWMINSTVGRAADWTSSQCTDSGECKFDDSLAFSLSNYGYDVWLGNMRGSVNCLEHSTLNAFRDAKYWDFSIDEMAKFDVPAMISYVKTQSNSAKVDYIGLSQGATMLFAALADCPELASSVNRFIAIACPVRLVSTNLYVPIFIERIIMPILKSWLTSNPGPLIPHWVENVMVYLISNNWVVSQPKGSFVFEFQKRFLHATSFCGTNHFNLERCNEITAFAKVQIARRNVAHLIQMRYTSKFGKFDFGKELNITKYGTADAPLYNLSAINPAKITIMYSEGDRLVTPTDIHYLCSQLGGTKNTILVERHDYDHFDYQLGYASGLYVNKPIIKLLASSE